MANITFLLRFKNVIFEVDHIAALRQLVYVIIDTNYKTLGTCYKPIVRSKASKKYLATEVLMMKSIFELLGFKNSRIRLILNCEHNLVTSPEEATLRTTGAFALIDSVRRQGVKHIFGYPGGAILPVYDEIYQAEARGEIKHYLVRHEQGAVHAADGYARATGQVGVCVATSGPGATNLVTGIATAQMD